MPPTDDESEEEIVEEEKLPVLQSRTRRKQVMAKPQAVPDDYKPPVFSKSPAEEAFLKETMDQNKLMKNLAPSDRDTLIQALGTKTFGKGETIIKQGDVGDLFYIVYEGDCDISVTGTGTVMKASKGSAFGELALLHNAPRAATVVAESPVTAFTLDEYSFKAILMGKAKKDHVDYLGFLDEMPILKSLDKDAKLQLASSLEERQYAADADIIHEGDEGNDFFIVRDGEVKCTKAGSDAEVSKRLTRGDCFGELALLRSDKRAATVTATQKTNVLVLRRSAFERLLGPLAEMQQAAEKY